MPGAVPHPHRPCRALRRAGALVAAAAAVAITTACGTGPARLGDPPPRSAASAPRSLPPAPPETTTTAAPSTTAPAGPPFTVQRLTIPLVDDSRPTVADGVQLSPHRALTTVVWLPAAAGHHPLVVFGPGFDVGPSTYQALLSAWASHGYVVAGVEFPLADPAVAGSHLDEADLQNEPADLRFVADALVAPGSPVAGRVDRGRVAVAGHSDGGEAALAACASPTPPGEPAFRAAVTMSVQPLPQPAPYPNPPILITQGDADTINPPSYGYATFADASDPKYLVVLHGGGHLPPLEPGSRWLPSVTAVTEAFLDAYLAGDGSPRAILAAGGDPALTTVRAG